MEVFRRSTKAGFVCEIGRVDNQRVPFPVTNRIPHPTAEILGKMLYVHPHDTCIVHHLRKNHDRVWSLHDLMQIVIKIVWERWRARRRAEPKNAALAEGPLLRIVKSPRRLCPRILALTRLGRWRCRSRGEALPRSRIVRRYMAVRRVDDERCSNLSIHHGVFRTLVQPYAVIAADRTTTDQLQSFKERFRFAGGKQIIFSPSRGFSFLQGVGLRFYKEGGIPWLPLQGSHRAKVVNTLQVGMSISRTW